MASDSQTSLLTSDKTCSTTTESTVTESIASPSSATTTSIIYDPDRDYGGVAYEATNTSKPPPRPPTRTESRAAILQWQSTMMAQAVPQQATPTWTHVQNGFYIMPGTIFVKDVGIRPLTEAWFHLVLGRHVVDHEWQPVTAESLERIINPQRNVDPIILRQRLWTSMPADAWWNMSHGAKQPGLDVDMISTYYGQRCDRSTQEVFDGPSMRRFSSTSGAGILVKPSARRDSLLDDETASTAGESASTRSFAAESEQAYLQHRTFSHDSDERSSMNTD